MLSKLFLCSFLVTFSATQPIFIRSGISNLQSQGLNGGLLSRDLNRGLSSYISNDGFNLDNERNYVGAQNSGRFTNDLADNKNYVNEKDFSDNTFQKQGGDLLSNIGRNQGHKVGHQNSGFKNTYHKDESGSTSNFYDDSDNRGNEYLQNTRQGQFGQLGYDRNRNGYLDNGRLYKDNSRRGFYGQEGLYDKNYGTQRKYNQEKLYGDRLLQGQRHRGNEEGQLGRYEEIVEPHGFHGRPGYFRRQPIRSHIPVYEHMGDMGHGGGIMGGSFGGYY